MKGASKWLVAITWILMMGGVATSETKLGVEGTRFTINGEPKEKYSVISGIRVLPGKTTKDPRLQNVDLHRLFEEVRVLVQDEEGRPMKWAYIPDLNVHTFSSHPGLLRILVGRGRRHTVSVKARGYKAEKVELVPGETILVRLKKEPERPPSRKGRRKVESGGVGTSSSGGGGF